MAVPSSFRERLEQMEHSRNERSALLEAEKELQNCKSQILASKLMNIRFREQRCLKIDRKIASQHLIISSLKSQLHHLDSLRFDSMVQFSALKDEVEKLKELAKERDCYYASESREMECFGAQRESYVGSCRLELAQLRGQASKLKSNFSKLQTGINYSNNSEIAAAEMKKCRLLSEKESIDLLLVSNIRARDRLRKQLRMILADQNHQGRR